MQSILTCPPVPKGPRAALGSSRRRGSPQDRDYSGRRPSIFRPFGAPAAGTRTAPPRVAFPRSVCSLAPAPELIKQKNFCKLSSPNTRGFHKSGPPVLRTCIQSSRKAGVGRWCAVEGTPKFPGRPWVSRRARRAPVPLQALSGFPSPGTLSPRSFPGDAARPSEGEEVGSNFRGLCGLTKLRFWSPHLRGPRGNSSEGRVSAGREGGEGCRRAHLFLQRPGSRALRLGVWRGENPKVELPDSHGCCGLRSASSTPKWRARPSLGPLTDSADTQATKPKVSRIQARRIFPEDRLGVAAGTESGTKPLAQHRAQPAERDPEQSSRSDRGSGSGASARGSETLAASSCACSPVLRCTRGTRRLLTWFLRSRHRVVALGKLLSGALLALLLFLFLRGLFPVSWLGFFS